MSSRNFLLFVFALAASVARGNECDLEPRATLVRISESCIQEALQFMNPAAKFARCLERNFEFVPKEGGQGAFGFVTTSRKYFTALPNLATSTCDFVLDLEQHFSFEPKSRD